MNSLRKVLVTDFDGTLTETDFYSLVAQRLPKSFPNLWVEYHAGRLSHFEALERYFRQIDSSYSEMEELLDLMDFDPQAAASIQSLRDAGWQIVVASAGCDWYIRKLLARHSIELEVHANPGVFEPSTGLVMTLPTDSPFFSPSHGIDKAAIVAHYIDLGATVAFIGDGLPDVEASKLVPEQLRFARRDLAQALTRDKLGYRSYHRWSQAIRLILETSL